MGVKGFCVLSVLLDVGVGVLCAVHGARVDCLLSVTVAMVGLSTRLRWGQFTDPWLRAQGAVLWPCAHTTSRWSWTVSPGDREVSVLQARDSSSSVKVHPQNFLSRFDLENTPLT